MAAEIVNLRQARKQKARAAAAQQAAENSARFGQTKAARDQEAREAARVRKVFDGHRQDHEPQQDDGSGSQP